MSSAPPFRRMRAQLPLDDELARLAEALRLGRNGGFVLISYDAPQQLDGWLAALAAQLGDVRFGRLTLPADGVGLLPQLAAMAQSSELARHELGVLVVGGVEALLPAAAARLVENLNLMRTRLAQVAYPILFGASGDVINLLLREAPDLVDRVGLWCDLRGHTPPAIALSQAPLTIEGRYREVLIRRLRLVEFRGILSINKPVTLPLTEFYVPLHGEEQVERASALPPSLSLEDLKVEHLLLIELAVLRLERKTIIKSQRWFGPEDLAQEATLKAAPKPVALVETVAAHAAFVVLGDPGAGKSTLLRALALAAAEDEPARMGLPERDGSWLPLLVSCAAYGVALTEVGDEPLDVALACVAEQYESPGLAEIARAAIATGRVLLLFDGLDEILDGTQRSAVTRAIDGVLRTILPAGNRAVVSSRIAGYSANALPSVRTTVTLRDFDDAQMAMFLQRWCVAFERFARGELPEAVADGERLAAQLASEIASNAGARRLAGNPLLLTIMALIHRQGVRLPERRVELYDIAARTLVESWNRARSLSGTALKTLPDPRLVIGLLGELALWMQQHAAAGTAQAEQLLPVLAEAYRRRSLPGPEASAAAFLRDVQEYSGLLVERGPDVYSFLHLTFQEYFAARHLASLGVEERWQIIEPHLLDPRWRETILLTAGELGVRIGRASEVTDLVCRVRGAAGLPPWAVREPLAKLRDRLLMLTLPWLSERQLDALEERMLQRRLLLSGAILADDVGVEPAVALGIVKALLELLRSPIQDQVSDLQACLRALPSSVRLQAQELLVVALAHASSNGERLAIINQIDAQAAQATPAVVDALLATLRDPDKSVRFSAARALGQLGTQATPAVVDAFLTALRDPDNNVRYSAARALGQLGTQATPAVVDALLAALRDPDNNVRVGATYVLGQLGTQATPAVVDALLTALRDPDESVRASAASALDQLGDRSKALRLAQLRLLNQGDYMSNEVYRALRKREELE